MAILQIADTFFWYFQTPTNTPCRAQRYLALKAIYQIANTLFSVLLD